MFAVHEFEAHAPSETHVSMWQTVRARKIGLQSSRSKTRLVSFLKSRFDLRFHVRLPDLKTGHVMKAEKHPVGLPPL